MRVRRVGDGAERVMARRRDDSRDLRRERLLDREARWDFDGRGGSEDMFFFLASVLSSLWRGPVVEVVMLVRQLSVFEKGAI